MSMNSERFRIWLAFFIVCGVWGSTWLAIKIGLQTVPPFLAAGLRFAVASGVLLLIVRFRRLPIPLTRDAQKVYLTLGVISFSIPFALVYWGQQFIPSGLSSVLFAAYPFWVAIFSHLFLKDEPLDLFKSLGIVLGFLGLLVIFSSDLHWSDPMALLGMCAVLVSTVLQGFSLIMIKKYGQLVSPFVMTFVGISIGAVVLVAMGFLFEEVASVVWNSVAVGSIIYLAVVGSVLTFVSYYWLLKRIEAVYLSLTSLVNPIVAVLLGALVLGETLEPATFAGAALVLLGILVANGKYFYEKIRMAA